MFLAGATPAEKGTVISQFCSSYHMPNLSLLPDMDQKNILWSLQQSFITSIKVAPMCCLELTMLMIGAEWRYAWMCAVKNKCGLHIGPAGSYDASWNGCSASGADILYCSCYLAPWKYLIHRSTVPHFHWPTGYYHHIRRWLGAYSDHLLFSRRIGGQPSSN